MGVISDNNPYGEHVPGGLIFSFPCTVDAATKEWKIVENLTFDDFARRRIEETAKELSEERGEAGNATATA